MSPKDIVEFVKSVFEKCDVQELNRYMEARKKVTKKDFTRFQDTIASSDLPGYPTS